MSKDVEIMLFEEINSEAERSFALGDALDMKANVWLVVITFLATQTAYFLSKNLSTYAYRGQIASAVALAGVLTLICLCPRDSMLFPPAIDLPPKNCTKIRYDFGAKKGRQGDGEAEVYGSGNHWSDPSSGRGPDVHRGSA